MKKDEKNSRSNMAELEAKNSHSKHMKMMVICCGAPLLIIIALGVFSISAPSLEIILLVICPIGMGAMMWVMKREQRSDSRGHSCCQSNAENEERAKHDKNHASADTLAQASAQSYKNLDITK